METSKQQNSHLKTASNYLAALCFIKFLFVAGCYGWLAFKNPLSLSIPAVVFNTLSVCLPWFLAVCGLFKPARIIVLLAILTAYAFNVNIEILGLLQFYHSVDTAYLIESISSVVLLLLLVVWFIMASINRKKQKSNTSQLILERYKKFHTSSSSPFKICIMAERHIWLYLVTALIIYMPISGIYNSGLNPSFTDSAVFFTLLGAILLRILLMIRIYFQFDKYWPTLNDVIDWQKVDQKLEEFNSTN